MRKNFKFISLILSVVLCLAFTAFGQETVGNIEGIVKDQTSAVVPNVTVTVTNTQGATAGFRRTTVSDKDGFYRVLQVPPGSYTVATTAAGGFGAAKYDNVPVAIGETTQVNLTVDPKGTENTVDVSVSDALPVDATNNAINNTVSAKQIELVPRGVDFTSILKTVPGTRFDSKSGGFTVDGASGSENVFVIDGQEVSNFRTGTLNGNNAIPTQFVQEVQVKSSGFGAEFGGATGGVISVVTKGGSNDFHGEFGAQFETPKFNGNPRPFLQRFTSGTGAAFVQSFEYFNPPKSGGSNFFPTANLGGPIVKDKLYFFGSYTPQVFKTQTETKFYTNAPAATRVQTAQETFNLTRTFEYAFIRLDATPWDNLRLTGTYTWNPIVDEGNVPFGTISLGGVIPSVDFGGTIGRLTGPALTNLQGGRQSSNNLTAQGVYIARNNLVISGRFSRGFLNEKLGNYFVPPGFRTVCQSGSTTIPGACATGAVSPANAENTRDVSIRTSYELDATVNFNGGGRHELKGGYQRFEISNDALRGYAAKGRIDFYYGFSLPELGSISTPTAPVCLAGQVTNCILGVGELIRVGTIGTASNLNQGLYIQDKWQPIKRLTLNLGIRFEKEDLPSFNGFAPPINFGWGDKIAPRLGFAYDLFGDGKTKIFGSYGQYYDRLKFELPRGSFGGDIQLIDFFEIFPGEAFTLFNPAMILGSFTGPSRCPLTGFIAPGARSRCQQDQRVASNDPQADIFNGGQVDPNVEPFRQTEFTVGFERQLNKDYVFRARYTFKNVDQAIEDAGIRNNEDSEAYVIGNPGQGLHLEVLRSLGYTKSITPQRRYDAGEFVLEKRLSNNYYFNMNYTYSRLYGNYSGLASSDENGRASPGVNRFFDLPFAGFTAKGLPDNGLLPTDRPHVFNAFGAYIFDWNSKTNTTELSVFQTIQSGTPQTTFINFITIAQTILNERGDMGRTPTLTQTDFAVTHRYKFGRDDRYTMAFDLNFLNLFDQRTVTRLFTAYHGVNIVGPTLGYADNAATPTNAFTSGALYTPIVNYLAGTATALNRRNINYGNPDQYQGPRNVRFGFRFLF